MNRIISISMVCIACAILPSCYAAEQPANVRPRDLPLEIKTSFEPEKTRVAILPIEDLREGKNKGKIEDQLQLGYQALRDAFGTRGFILIPSGQIPAATSRLNDKNGNEVSTTLKADLVIDCGLKELQGKIDFWGKKSSKAVIRLAVHSVKDGRLVDTEFVSSRKGGYHLLATGNRGRERSDELCEVIDLALQGLLKPYPTLAEKAAGKTKQETPATNQ